MAVLRTYTACIICAILLFETDGQICNNTEDPCEPPAPCELGARLSNPADCHTYRTCVAPYEWAVTEAECGGSKGAYSNTSCNCQPETDCQVWGCPPNGPDTAAPPQQPAPCFPGSEPICSSLYYAVPDRYYCSRYFACVSGQWLSRACPAGFFYDIYHFYLDPPCINNHLRCQAIGFDDCLVETTTSSVTSDPTESAPGASTTATTSTGPGRSSTTGASPGNYTITTPEYSTPTTTDPRSPLACEPLTTCQDGQRVAHVDDCQLYFECLDGVWAERNCQQQNDKKPYYNPKKAKCQKKFMVDCSVRCNFDTIRVDKMTKNIVLIVLCCVAGVAVVVLLALWLCRRPETDNYDYKDLDSSSMASTSTTGLSGPATVSTPASSPSREQSPHHKDHVYEVSPRLPSQQVELDDVMLLEYRPIWNTAQANVQDTNLKDYCHLSGDRAALYRPTDLDALTTHVTSLATRDPVYLHSMALGPRPTTFGVLDL